MKILELTLALLKPDVQRFRFYVNETEKLIKQNNLQIICHKELCIDKTLAQQFYSCHKGKFYCNRLVNYMTCGLVGAYIMAGENAISCWRSLLGPTKVYKLRAVHEEPNCLRSRFGLTDTRNGFHGSDSMENALKEIQIIFPEFNVKSFLN